MACVFIPVFYARGSRFGGGPLREFVVSSPVGGRPLPALCNVIVRQF